MNNRHLKPRLPSTNGSVLLQRLSKSVLEARPIELDKGNSLKTEGQEILLAGYVGFKKVEDLRRLMISWPILVLWPLFNENAAQMQKKSSFRLAH